MSKPRVLVLTAVGKTGLPTALQLLSEGFPVTAFVRKEDRRSERLKSHGADIVAGSVTDLADMRRAMAGAQRAYFCAPIEKGYLTAGAVFAAAAAEHGIESLVVMSQWLSNPFHPAVHTVISCGHRPGPLGPSLLIPVFIVRPQAVKPMTENCTILA